MCPRFYALVCGRELAVTFFFDLWSVRRKTTAQSPHKGNPAGVFGRVHLKPCWLDALKYIYGAVALHRVQQRGHPTSAATPKALVSGLTGRICLTDISFYRQWDLNAGGHLSTRHWRLWWHDVYPSDPGWMSENERCVGQLVRSRYRIRKIITGVWRMKHNLDQ